MSTHWSLEIFSDHHLLLSDWQMLVMVPPWILQNKKTFIGLSAFHMTWNVTGISCHHIVIDAQYHAVHFCVLCIQVLNRLCVEQTILLAFALNCTLQPVSRFDRKHYFYADSPSGYQITQQFHPIATDGYLDYVWSGRAQCKGNPSPSVLLGVADKSGHQFIRSRARIRRIQIEQDTGKSLHDPIGERSLIDFNRAGVELYFLRIFWCFLSIFIGPFLQP